MLQKSIVMTAACLEIAAGAILLVAPDVASRLIFAATLEGVGIAFSRFAGVGLFALGIACLPSRVATLRRSPIFGLFVFNFGVATLFATLGITTTFQGVLLWPAVVLHGAIAAALLPQLLTCKTVGTARNGEGAPSEGVGLRHLP